MEKIKRVKRRKSNKFGKNWESKFGYNITLGGESGLGYKHTDETKKRISESEKGRPSPMKGRHHSEETKKKISESQKGKPKPKPTTIEYKEKMRNAILGTKFSEERKIKHRIGITKYQQERLDTVIIQTDLHGKIINKWQSQNEASRKLNIPQSTIGLHVKNGKPYKNNFFIKLDNYKDVKDNTR